jgi:hypothetical protein
MYSQINTAAASFTLNQLDHFRASPATFGVGSTVNTQYGFHAVSTLTGATNNYGFYGNIASGTGRWNFYANGTAQNYFSGVTSVGGVPQVLGAITPQFQVVGTTFNGSTIGAARFSTSGSPGLILLRSRGATVGTNTIVEDSDGLGGIFFRGANGGTGYIESAAISAAVDGTPGTSAMPGRLVFSTTPSGSSTPVERMRIDSAGKILASAGTNWVGTVSQNGQSSIVERGSNANGEFVKFADGTLICTAEIDITNLPTGTTAASTTVTLPAQRIALGFTPTAQVTISAVTSKWSANEDRGKYMFSSRSDVLGSLTLVYYAIVGTSPTGGNGAVGYTLTTRWY